MNCWQCLSAPFIYHVNSNSCSTHYVYIYPRADTSAAAQLIVDVTHRLDSTCPEAPKFILEDFNRCFLSKNFEDVWASCSTTQRNTVIDLCHGSESSAYDYAIPWPIITLFTLGWCPNLPSDARNEKWRLSKHGRRTVSPHSKRALIVQTGISFLMKAMSWYSVLPYNILCGLGYPNQTGGLFVGDTDLPNTFNTFFLHSLKGQTGPTHLFGNEKLWENLKGWNYLPNW